MDKSDLHSQLNANLDLVGWIPEQITLLIRREVKDPILKILTCLDSDDQKDVYRQIESILQTKSLAWSNAKRTQMEEMLQSFLPTFQYRLFERNENMNVCWLGKCFWGVTFDNYFVVGHQPTAFQLTDLTFVSLQAFRDFAYFFGVTVRSVDEIFSCFLCDNGMCEDIHIHTEIIMLRKILASKHELHNKMKHIPWWPWCEDCGDLL
jgi:hypothetical protein